MQQKYWDKYGEIRCLTRNRLLFEHHRQMTKIFLDYFASVDTKAKVLEIGCGDGYWLGLLRDLGFENIQGIDLSEPFLEVSRKKGLVVRKQNIYDISAEEKYDIVLLCAVLEHLEDPIGALKKVNNILVHGGILYLTIPVYDSFLARYQRLKKVTTKIEQARKQDDTHIQELTFSYVAQLLAETGYEIELARHSFNPWPVIPRVSQLAFEKSKKLTVGGRYGDNLSVVARKLYIKKLQKRRRKPRTGAQKESTRVSMIVWDFPPETGGMQRETMEIINSFLEDPRIDGLEVIAPKKYRMQHAFSTFFDIEEFPSFWQTAVWILRHFRVYKPDVIHIFHPALSFLGYLTKKVYRIPYVVSVNGLDIIQTPGLGSLSLDRSRKLIYKAVESAATVLCISEGTQKLVKERIPNAKTRVVTLGVDAEKFRPRDRQMAKGRLGFENEKIVLTVGRLVERKGFDLVLRALADLGTELDDFRYVIVGDGPYKQNITSQIDALNLQDKVTMLGFVSEETLVDVYSAADLFIMTPMEIKDDIEGFGLVYLEANACGLPVVATRIGGVESAVKDGVSGVLVEPGDADRLKDVIFTLLRDESKRLSLANTALDYAKENSWSKVAEAIIAVYRKAQSG